MTEESLREFAKSIEELCEVLVEESLDKIIEARVDGVDQDLICLTGCEKSYCGCCPPEEHGYDFPLSILLLTREGKAEFLKKRFEEYALKRRQEHGEWKIFLPVQCPQSVLRVAPRGHGCPGQRGGD